MKKLIPILFVVAAITACQKEPSLSKLDDDYVVFTDYDKSASFGDYLTYYMPDSVLLITDSEKATYWTNDEANYILETFAENMAARGFMLVDTKEEADLGLQVSYIEDVHYFVNYPSPNWWWGYMAGLQSSSPRVNQTLVIRAIDQAFNQSPYLTNQ